MRIVHRSMAMASRVGPRSGVISNWARSSTLPASANAPSTNTARLFRQTTIRKVHSKNPAATCKNLSSGKKAAKHQPFGEEKKEARTTRRIVVQAQEGTKERFRI